MASRFIYLIIYLFLWICALCTLFLCVCYACLSYSKETLEYVVCEHYCGLWFFSSAFILSRLRLFVAGGVLYVIDMDSSNAWFAWKIIYHRNWYADAFVILGCLWDSYINLTLQSVVIISLCLLVVLCPNGTTFYCFCAEKLLFSMPMTFGHILWSYYAVPNQVLNVQCIGNNVFCKKLVQICLILPLHALALNINSIWSSIRITPLKNANGYLHLP